MRNYLFILWVMVLSASAFAQGNSATDKVITIYQDADLSNHEDSSNAIQKGIEVAFGEIDNEIQGYKVVFNYLDHRGNVVRSKKNYEQFLSDPTALVIFSGSHSPPLIKNLSYINENKALTLVPWAAGGSITRYPSAENWVFRLSVDDTQAAPIIIDFAMNEQGCQQPNLLLESTPWGDSNLDSMSKELLSYGISEPDVSRFGWNLSELGARTLLRKVIEVESDCVILVGTPIEGATIIRAMLNLPAEQRLPIVSHWGITGGDFHEKITSNLREKIDLHFIQSCFAFTNPIQSDFSERVFEQLVEYTQGSINKPIDLKAPVGFIHAYDLTTLLIQAIKQVELTGDMGADRDQVRLALENIKTPVQGLVRTYEKPFSIFDTANNVNAHEALRGENYCMGRYGVNDEILISTTIP